ncbi:MAG: extracellular solute-binding protein [Clostridia bacterium]|nr:extracellular solute-binding protein [Clostridia bacterium]
MKRILAILLTLTLVASLGITAAFAEDFADGKFTTTQHLTVEVYNRYNDGGTDPTSSVYAQYIHDTMLEKYNVDVEFVSVGRWTEPDDIGNLLAAGTAPDVCVTYSYPTILSYADMGGIVDLSGPLAQYKDELGNLWALLEDYNIYYDQDPDTGALWDVEARLLNNARINTFIREDWLAKLGLAVPTTTEEFEACLIAFRDNAETLLGADADKMIPYLTTSDVGWMNNQLINSKVANDLSDEMAFVYGYDDRQSLYPGAKEGIRVLNKWYNEGLIWKDFVLNDSDQADNLLKSGWVGAFQHNYDYPYRNGEDSIQASIKRAAGEDAAFLAIEPFTNDAGIPRKFLSDRVDRKCFLPSTCSNVHAALLYLNHISDPEVIKYLQVGPEGIVHEKTEDGAYKLLTMSDEDKAVWIQNSLNNIDHTITANGQYLGDATVASLALGYASVDPKYITIAYETAMHEGRVVAKFSVGAIESENEVGSSLNSYRDTWLCQAIVAAEADFDSVYDAGLQEYLDMGGQEIINERAQKLSEVYGVEIATDLAAK